MVTRSGGGNPYCSISVSISKVSIRGLKNDQSSFKVKSSVYRPSQLIFPPLFIEARGMRCKEYCMRSFLLDLFLFYSLFRTEEGFIHGGIGKGVAFLLSLFPGIAIHSFTSQYSLSTPTSPLL